MTCIPCNELRAVNNENIEYIEYVCFNSFHLVINRCPLLPGAVVVSYMLLNTDNYVACRPYIPVQ